MYSTWVHGIFTTPSGIVHNHLIISHLFYEIGRQLAHVPMLCDFVTVIGEIQ